MRARPEMMMTSIFFIGPPIFGLHQIYTENDLDLGPATPLTSPAVMLGLDMAPALGAAPAAHVVVDELGHPYWPEWYSDQFRNLAKTAVLPVIRLHDARHTCGTLMHLRGVPTAVISKWLGHATAPFTMATYGSTPKTMLWRRLGPCTPQPSGPTSLTS
jgi:hypothetical protein